MSSKSLLLVASLIILAGTGGFMFGSFTADPPDIPNEEVEVTCYKSVEDGEAKVVCPESVHLGDAVVFIEVKHCNEYRYATDEPHPCRDNR